MLLKDDKLAFIEGEIRGNIAQYISISPKGEIRYVKLNGGIEKKTELKMQIIQLIKMSRSQAVNIRSFSKTQMKGNKLVYNKSVEDIEEILKILEENCRNNKYSIINENIDINDGGVSGVVLGDIIEFSPQDTPKCVENEGTCLLEKNMGYHILKRIYGFEPEIRFDENYRVEFSLHPNREGVKQAHTVIWEYEKLNELSHEYKIQWPNNFSKFIGDKTFGLLVAEYLGLKVPYTTVISRNVAPFSFGKSTGLHEKWIRTAPIIKESGKYFSGNKWRDPYLLMNEEELKGKKKINISAILSQDAVESVFSGAAIIGENKKFDIIEGVSGNGETFMLGEKYQKNLPDDVVEKVQAVLNHIRSYNNVLGLVSIEWVFDGENVWVVQMNQIKNISTDKIIVSGNPKEYVDFKVEEGLEKLREAAEVLVSENVGVNLIGNVGITSHFGDVLRQYSIPSKITIPRENQ